MKKSALEQIAVATVFTMKQDEYVPEVVTRYRDDVLSVLLNAYWSAAFYGVGAIASLRAVFLALSFKNTFSCQY